MSDPTVTEESADGQVSKSTSQAQHTQQKDGAASSAAQQAQHLPHPVSSSSTDIARNSTTHTSNTTSLPRVASSQRQATASLDGIMEGTRDRLTKDGSRSPSWPTSPRLKSPPPSGARAGSRRDSTEQAQSNTAKRLAPVSAPELASAILKSEGMKDQPQPQPSSHLRVPPRNTTTQNTGLETVVEGSVPTTPSIDPRPDPLSQSDLQSLDGKPEPSNGYTSAAKTEGTAELSRTTTNKPDSDQKSRAPSTSRPASTLAKRSFTSLTGSKKTVAEPVRTMTVETEPVSTTTTGLGDRNRDGGSVRTKTSTETIRPKKEKKKPVRKPGNLHPGTLTTKADIFEAKVASAVDEVDSDDSDETFVYESNPPEPRSYRHHSRTPSSTSLASTNDPYRGNKSAIRNGSSAAPGKKSMKFSNSIHSRENEDDPTRSGARNASSTPRHHHIGRYGRNHPPSLFDSDSPFNQSRLPNAPRNAAGNMRSPRPQSPRLANGRVASPRKYGGSAYDNNEDVADDERAPLMGTVRRNRHSRRPHSRDFRSLDLGEPERVGCWSRCGAWLLLFVLFLFICIGVGTFVMAVNRPLFDVEIRKIMNVLASEQELMLDLDVKAINPNLFAVTVTDLDVNLFAESPYVGTTAEWERQHLRPGLRLSISERRKRGWFWPDPPKPADGVDDGTDPDDPGLQKMLLGRVFEFDSPLTFEPTPVRRTATSSVGSIRLAKPGNHTEVGGSERWERVLLHDFDLIVRGVIKYQLPLSSKTRSATIRGRKTVHPDSEETTTRLLLED